jgi:hypothetical protein
MPLDMPVLQQPCAASGRVYSAADCAVSATALAASGRVPVFIAACAVSELNVYLFYNRLGCLVTKAVSETRDR